MLQPLRSSEVKPNFLTLKKYKDDGAIEPADVYFEKTVKESRELRMSRQLRNRDHYRRRTDSDVQLVGATRNRRATEVLPATTRTLQLAHFTRNAQCLGGQSLRVL